MRRIQINKLQRNAGFMEEWTQKGIDDWKENMDKKREREAKQLEFDLTQAEKYNKYTVNSIDEANREVYQGIAEFEANLKAKGINPKVDKLAADKAISNTLNGIPWQEK